MVDYYHTYWENYGEKYYETGCGTNYHNRESWMTFFRNIARNIVSSLNPHTVLDVGCAFGYLVEALRELGVEAWGIDISNYAVEQSAECVRPYLYVQSAVDPLPSTFPQKFDLIVSIEVLEHLHEEEMVRVLDRLVFYADKMLISASFSDFSEPTHFNVQPPAYWVRNFAERGFFESTIFDGSFLTPQTILVVRCPNMTIGQLAFDYKHALWLMQARLNMAEENTKRIKLEADQRVTIEKEKIRQNTRKLEKVMQNQFAYQIQELNNQAKHLTALEASLAISTTECQRIKDSKAYRLYSRVEKVFFPLGSKRRRLLLALYLTPRYILDGSFFRRIMRKTKQSAQHLLGNEENDRYYKWIELNEPDAQELSSQSRSQFTVNPKISIVVPVYNTPLRYFTAMVESVRNQSYTNWELCLADGSSDNRDELEQFIAALADDRIRFISCEKNEGISGNTNIALAHSTGTYIGFLDHDDTLAPFALYQIANCINHYNDADFIYSDDDRITNNNARMFPCFKPDFSADHLRACNFIGHFTVVARSLVDLIGNLNAEYDGSQDYDFVLRATEKATRIVHIPRILYHFRMHEQSVAQNENAKPYAYLAAKAAIQASLDRQGLCGTVEDGVIRNSYRIKYAINGCPKVTIVIPTMDHIDDLRNCIESILHKSTYPNYEVLLIENNSNDKETFAYYERLSEDSRVRILTWDGTGFNYAALINFGVTNADGEYVITLNNDTEVITPEWIEELLMFAQRSDVGMVGGRLYYRDGTLWNSGLALDNNRSVTLLHNKIPGDSSGYYGRAVVVQCFSALAGACLMFRRETYMQIGGMDDVLYKVAHNDIDLGLKIIQRGLCLVYTPFCELYHFESKSRGSDLEGENLKRFMVEDRCLLTSWKDYLQYGDPFYNINLSLETPNFEVRTEKIQYRY